LKGDRRAYRRRLRDEGLQAAFEAAKRYSGDFEPKLDIHKLAEGATLSLPTSVYGVFTPEAAQKLVGTYTTLTGKDNLGEHSYRMEIVEAEVVDDGRVIRVTLEPPSQGPTKDFPGGSEL
jgi:hypothetical protein